MYAVTTQGWKGRCGGAVALRLSIFAAAAVAAAVSGVLAAQFDSPPTLDSRRVFLTWPPDVDDPYYTGNTILERQSVLEFIHPPGSPVRTLVFNGSGSTAYSFAGGEGAVAAWAFPEGNIIGDLTLAGGPQPLDLTIHGSDDLLLAGLPDGRVARWMVTAFGDGPEFFPAATDSVLGVAFYPAVPDTADQRFVSVGADDSLRVWARPGRILGPGYVRPIPDGATGALAITADRALAMAGTQGGEVRVWDIRTPPLGPRFRLQGHAGPVIQIILTRDQKRLASVDATGQVRVWRVADGQLLLSFETGHIRPHIEFSAPFGTLIFVGAPDGTLEFYDGFTGRFFNSGNLVGADLTTMDLTPDGNFVVMGDVNGRITVLRAGLCRPGPQQDRCFGGYVVWRSPTRDPADARMLRLYTYGDSTWTFSQDARAFVDPESLILRTNPPFPGDDEYDEEPNPAGPHNGIPYFYSLTRFDLAYESGGVFRVYPGGGGLVDEATAIHNGFYRDPGETVPTAIVAQPRAREQTPLLGQVIVVPNPYESGRVPWDLSGEPHVEFRNLPEAAKIRIYSVAGDLVRVLDHGPGRYGESRSTMEWDLRNSTAQRVASGVYVYQIETPSGEVIQGYCTVVF